MTSIEETEKLNELQRTGTGLQAQLDTHYSQWETGLSFRTIFPKFGARAKSIGMDINDFSVKLEEMGYIKIRSTPSGKRTVFSSNCPLTDEELRAHLQEQELTEQAEKDAKKALRA